MLCYQKPPQLGRNQLRPPRRGSASSHSAAARFLLVWDFDWSLIDNNDTYVIERLVSWTHLAAARALMANGKMGWTSSWTGAWASCARRQRTGRRTRCPQDGADQVGALAVSTPTLRAWSSTSVNANVYIEY